MRKSYRSNRKNIAALAAALMPLVVGESLRADVIL